MNKELAESPKKKQKIASNEKPNIPFKKKVSFSSLLEVSRKKPLIIFMDINGTVIAQDTSRGKDNQRAYLQLIAENVPAIWQKDMPDMTFRKYVDTYLIGGSNKDEKVKEKRLNKYTEVLTELEKIDFKRYSQAKKDIEKIQEKHNNSIVFKSFYCLIDYLEKTNYPYSIIFRTFGDDWSKVCDELSRKTTLVFENVGNFNEGILTIGDNKITSAADMLKKIKPYVHGSWRDDYNYWHKHHEQHHAGKIFPIDLKEKSTIQLFFDDNATDKEIVNILASQNDDSTQEERQKKCLQKGRLIPVNTYEALLDDDYFINKVKFALENKLENTSTTSVTTNSIFGKPMSCPTSSPSTFAALNK